MRIELAHDLIAKKIFDKATQEDKDRARARHIVAVKYDLYRMHKDILLTDKELALLKPHVKKLGLEDDKLKFIATSERSVAWHYRKNVIAYSIMGAVITIFSAAKLWESQYVQNIHNQELAENTLKSLYDLTQKVSNIRSVEDVRNLKITSETLQTQTLSNANAVSLLKTNGIDPVIHHSGGAGENKQLLLSSQLSPIVLRGWVKNKDNQPVAACKVFFSDFHTSTDKNGSFEFHILADPSLLPDSMPLQLEHPEWQQQTQAVPIKANEPLTIQLTSKKSSSLISPQLKKMSN